MAKSPFYTVVISNGNIDVTELVTSLNYEDCIDQDDLVDISIEGAEYAVLDKNYFTVGQELIFNFGFIGGAQSSNRRCIITESECTYGWSTVSMNVKARDLGFLMKKLTGSTVHKGAKSSEIIKSIADKFGLDSDIEDTDTEIETSAQGGRSFYDFIKEVAFREGSIASNTKGPIDFHVRGNKLTFKYRDLSVKSNRTYSYGDGDSPITGISVSYEDSGDGASSGISSGGIDTDTGEEYESKASPADNNESTTGDEALHFDVNSVLQIVTDQEDIGKRVTVAALSKDDADKKTGGLLKASASKIMKLTIDLELDPEIDAGSIITISGVAQIHAGNWRVTKCDHTISNSGATTVLVCVRNGSKKPSTTTPSTNSGAANTSQGPKDGAVTNDLIYYDTNSNPL